MFNILFWKSKVQFNLVWAVLQWTRVSNTVFIWIRGAACTYGCIFYVKEETVSEMLHHALHHPRAKRLCDVFKHSGRFSWSSEFTETKKSSIFSVYGKLLNIRCTTLAFPLHQTNTPWCNWNSVTVENHVKPKYVYIYIYMFYVFIYEKNKKLGCFSIYIYFCVFLFVLTLYSSMFRCMTDDCK